MGPILAKPKRRRVLTRANFSHGTVKLVALNHLLVRIEMPQQHRYVVQMRYGKNGAFTTYHVSAYPRIRVSAYSEFDAMRRAEQERPGLTALSASRTH